MAVSFDFKKRLGSGYFGEVWHASDSGLSCDIALKCIPQNKIINRANFYQEAQTLKASEHPNIVKVNDTGILADGRIYVSMEYLPKGSVEDEAKGAFLGLTRAKRLMIDLLRGLEHAHSKGIVHRDIKPANILIGNSNEAKLSDFGLAVPNINAIDVGQFKQYQYRLHLAPEVQKISDYTSLSDIYASGITLYRLVNGDTYLPQITVADAQAQSKTGKFPNRDHYRSFVPISLKKVINRAMSVEPSERYQSAAEMRHALENQKIYVDWSEQTIPRGILWDGFHLNGKCYRIVSKEIKTGVWANEFLHGNSHSSLRKKMEFCCKANTLKEARSKAKKILQSLTQQAA